MSDRWEGRHCSDHGCVWGHPGGMGTGGGCQHLKGDRHEIRRTLRYMSREFLALRAKVAEQEAELAAAREVVGRWRSEDFACGIYAGCHCYEVGSDDPCASCAVVEWIERYDETTGGGDRQSDG